jgi:hypothetical protein
MVYTVVDAGEATTTDPVVELRPVDGDQLTVGPAPIAVSVADVVGHIVALAAVKV